MKKYAYIKGNRVNQFLYAYSEKFPRVPLSKRFAKEIVDNCIEIDIADETIKEGMDYNSETGEFTEHIDEVLPEIVEETNTEEILEEETGDE